MKPLGSGGRGCSLGGEGEDSSSCSSFASPFDVNDNLTPDIVRLKDGRPVDGGAKSVLTGASPLLDGPMRGDTVIRGSEDVRTVGLWTLIDLPERLSE